MPYKISGSKSKTARVIVIKESDWSIESNTVISGTGSYEINDLESGYKTIIAEAIDGETLVYGNVSPETFFGDRGIYGGGAPGPTDLAVNVIDYVTITSIGNAQDFGDLTVSRANISATSNGLTGRAVFGGGGLNGQGGFLNEIDYVPINTTSNATDFGNLTIARHGPAATSNNTNDRAVFGGGRVSVATDTTAIDSVTISSTGNASGFGNLTISRVFLGATSNGTNDRGIFVGGIKIGFPNVNQNVIDYITISTGGTADDFGDLPYISSYVDGTSNLTNNRGVFLAFGGLKYITINTLGNAEDFGNLTFNRYLLSATSNGEGDRGVFGGGYQSGGLNNIDYITISTTGNATDFGELTYARLGLAATSDA